MEFIERAARLPNVETTTFESHMENLIAAAVGVVAMGGYNTFCEILSFDKPALLVPRTEPRREQLIRASRAEALGLVRTLPANSSRDPWLMAKHLHALPDQPTPSRVRIPGLLDGLEEINRATDQWLAVTPLPRPRESVPLWVN
jgi:predicted glycosyltransferase